MAHADATRWNSRWNDAPVVDIAPPSSFQTVSHLLVGDDALDVACGTGAAAVWLATQGIRVHGIDISSVAIAAATQRARDHKVTHLTRFVTHDLDDGLPAGPHVDLVICHCFRDPTLDDELVARLRPGGRLAIAVLSEVDSEPGPFRAVKGELAERFSSLDVLAAREEAGVAWCIAEVP